MILSGYQEFDYLKEGMQLGAVNYLMKPVNKFELIESLKKIKTRLDQQNEQKISKKSIRNYYSVNG